MKSLSKSIAVVLVFLFSEGLAMTQEKPSVFKITSVDLDFGMALTASNFGTDLDFNAIDPNNYVEEYVRYPIFQGSFRSTAGVPVFNVAANFGIYSSKKESYREGQSLRLSVGFLAGNQVGISKMRMREASPFDTLVTETTSSQTGQTEKDTIIQDSVTNMFNERYLSMQSIRFGGQFLFSFSKGAFTFSAGPGFDAMVSIKTELVEWNSSVNSIENRGGHFSSTVLQSESTSPAPPQAISSIGMMFSIVPHAAFFITKAAKKRNTWFDNTSVFASTNIGSQITFTNKYDLEPALAFGFNFGIRYGLN